MRAVMIRVDELIRVERALPEPLRELLVAAVVVRQPEAAEIGVAGRYRAAQVDEP